MSKEPEFQPLDFSRSELQSKFGEDANWLYDRLAQIANAKLREWAMNEGPFGMEYVITTILREEIDRLKAQVESARNIIKDLVRIGEEFSSEATLSLFRTEARIWLSQNPKPEPSTCECHGVEKCPASKPPGVCAHCGGDVTKCAC